MAELALTHDRIIALRASAHGLDPVVLMGAAGLSPALVKEIDRALSAHGLVKVRGGKSERAERDAMFLAMAEQLEAARVQVIGNTFVLFRPVPPAPETPPARTGKKAAKRAPAKSAGRATGNFARGDAQKERIAVKRATVRGAAPRKAGPSGFGAGKRAGTAPPPRKRAPAGGTRQR